MRFIGFIAMVVRRWNPFFNSYEDEVGQGSERSGAAIKTGAATELVYTVVNDYFLLRMVSITNTSGGVVTATLEDGAGGADVLYVYVANNVTVTLIQLEGCRFLTTVNCLVSAWAGADVRLTVGGLDRDW